MKAIFPWPAVAVSLLLTLGPAGSGRAVVSDHVSRGRIVQGQVCDDPNQVTGLFYFLLEVQTDARVSHVGFLTAMGLYGEIPADEHTISGALETYHWVDGATHIWEYWGYFENADALHNYGDGLYTIVLHYADSSQEPTTVWYAIPGTDQALPTPTQIPSVPWPPHNGRVASPVTFEWDPVTDPNVGDIYLSVVDANGVYVITDVYGVNAITSSPYGMKEGPFDIELAFESFYGITNPDGIPFELSKNSTRLQPFEVAASSVYRFWSPATDRHFYTVDEAEKDKLITDYSGVWRFEGPVFYAWTSPYDPNMVPVYRFWSNASSSHFYTVREDEKNKLIDSFSDTWTYEGVAFYAYAPGSQPDDSDPVYRFWKRSDNSYFYTIDPDEKDKLIKKSSSLYTFEGIAFYAWR